MAGPDKNIAFIQNILSSSYKAVAVTPDDNTDLTFYSRALYVGGTGDISAILQNDITAVTFVAVPAGSILPIRAKRVRATGTTATSIINLG